MTGRDEKDPGEVIDRVYREVIRTQITVAALAAREGVLLACDDEVDDVIAARS